MRKTAGVLLIGGLTVSTALLTACGSKAAQLRLQGASDLRCGQEAITVDSMGVYIEKVTGCGQENVYFYSMMESRWISPMERASFDLSCPKEQLRAQHLGGLQVGVLGCNKKAVYVAGQSGWVMNVAEQGPPPYGMPPGQPYPYPPAGGPPPPYPQAAPPPPAQTPPPAQAPPPAQSAPPRQG